MRFRTKSINANEIANGILSALVSITAGCAFVPYWGGVLIGCKHNNQLATYGILDHPFTSNKTGSFRSYILPPWFFSGVQTEDQRHGTGGTCSWDMVLSSKRIIV